MKNHMKAVIRFKTGDLIRGNSRYLYSKTERKLVGYEDDKLKPLNPIYESIEYHYYEISIPVDSQLG